MKKMSCKHKNTHSGEAWCFTGSVAVYPYTDENPAAHGNVGVTETCTECGAERDVLVNGRHVEYSPWGLSRAERERDQERQRQHRTCTIVPSWYTVL